MTYHDHYEDEFAFPNFMPVCKVFRKPGRANAKPKSKRPWRNRRAR